MSIQSHVRNSADSKGSRNSVTTALLSKTKRKPAFTESLLEDQETTVQSRASCPAFPRAHCGSGSQTASTPVVEMQTKTPPFK